MNAAVTTVWSVIVPLVQDVPDPEDVKPGWLGFGVFLLLVAAVVVLAFSFRKQLKKVNFPVAGSSDTEPDAEHATPEAGDDTAPDGPEEGPGR